MPASFATEDIDGRRLPRPTSCTCGAQSERVETTMLPDRDEPEYLFLCRRCHELFSLAAWEDSVARSAKEAAL